MLLMFKTGDRLSSLFVFAAYRAAWPTAIRAHGDPVPRCGVRCSSCKSFSDSNHKRGNVSSPLSSVLSLCDKDWPPLVLSLLILNRISVMFVKITLAGAPFVEELTGFRVGTIPPVGHRTRLKTLVDVDLLNYSTLLGGAGDK